MVETTAAQPELTSMEFGNKKINVFPEWSNVDPTEIMSEDTPEKPNQYKEYFGASWEIAKAYNNSFSAIKDPNLRKYYQFEGLMRFAKIDNEKRAKFLSQFSTDEIEQVMEKAETGEELEGEEIKIGRAVVAEEKADLRETLRTVVEKTESDEQVNRIISEAEMTFIVMTMKRLEAVKNMDEVLQFNNVKAEFNPNDDIFSRITTLSSSGLRDLIKILEKGVISTTQDFRHFVEISLVYDLSKRVVGGEAQIDIIKASEQGASPKKKLKTLAGHFGASSDEPASAAG